MSKIFEEIAVAHKKLTGWCSLTKAQTLAATVLSIRPSITVEIGVWGGKSLIPMAIMHRHINHGKVWAIDPWSQTASIQGQVNPEDVEWWSHQDRHNYAYSEFEKNLVENGLMGIVHIERFPSDDVEPPDGIGLFHCDGNHGEQAIRDIVRFAPKIIVGGVAVLDDIGWTGGAINLAVEKLLQSGFVELYRVTDESSTWAVFQRIK